MNSVKWRSLVETGLKFPDNFITPAFIGAILSLFFCTFLTSPLIAGSCPDFHLRTTGGVIINPITGDASDQPYSTRQTCGSCHDYNRISNGYHFQMGRNAIRDDYSKTEPWVLSPGMTGKF